MNLGTSNFVQFNEKTQDSYPEVMNDVVLENSESFNPVEDTINVILPDL